MRGHIGFKIGNKPSAPVRITLLRSSILVSEIPAPTTRLTMLRSSILVTAAPSAPSAPASLSASTTTTAGTVALVFPTIVDNGSPITSYVAGYSTDGTTWTPVTVSAETVETSSSGLVGQKRLLISGLTIGTEYAFRLAAVNAVGTGPFGSYAPTAIPTASNSFTTYIDNDGHDYSLWRNTGILRTSVQINGRTVLNYNVTNWEAFTTAQPVVANFTAHIEGSAAESNICTYPYNLDDCLYTYNYQMQSATGEPIIQNWTSVSTPSVTVFDTWTYPGSSIELQLPEYPQTLIFVPYIDGLNLAVNVTYWVRCIVTRKSDNAVAVSPPVRLFFTDNGGD